MQYLNWNFSLQDDPVLEGMGLWDDATGRNGIMLPEVSVNCNSALWTGEAEFEMNTKFLRHDKNDG